MGFWLGGGIFAILITIIILIIRIAFVVLIIYAIVKAIEYFRNGGANGANSPLEILKRRYARGEITKEEFERMKNELRY